MKKLVVRAVFVAAVAGILSTSCTHQSDQPVADQAAPREAGEVSQDASKGMAAMEAAAQRGNYLFAFFHKQEDDQTVAMRKVLAEVIQEVDDRADWVEVDVTSPKERPIVEEFGLEEFPMPLILALAPNGAITGGFPTAVQKHELLASFASPCTQQSMRLLQENKLVFLCIQNESTLSNDVATEGVRQFQQDPRLGQKAEIVYLDPADEAEADFLGQLQIDPNTPIAVTVFLVPPGAPIAIYEGPTNKDQLVATLERTTSVR